MPLLLFRMEGGFPFWNARPIRVQDSDTRRSGTFVITLRSHPTLSGGALWVKWFSSSGRTERPAPAIWQPPKQERARPVLSAFRSGGVARSEEHTSELQSQ